VLVQQLFDRRIEAVCLFEIQDHPRIDGAAARTGTGTVGATADASGTEAVVIACIEFAVGIPSIGHQVLRCLVFCPCRRAGALPRVNFEDAGSV
jgi:hypothetical protein